jgi:hypothetical protein
MTHRPLAVALLLALLVFPASVGAAAAPWATQDTSALQFRGFRAGARLDALDSLARRSGGRLRCDRAKRDPRVTECRATVKDSMLGTAKVWLSAMDSLAGVITVSASLDSSALGRWRTDLERRYGRVPVRRQGVQSMLQWVRRGRMVRLTWRTERGELSTSVSLVDGRVLDAWGAQRAEQSP